MLSATDDAELYDGGRPLPLVQVLAILSLAPSLSLALSLPCRSCRSFLAMPTLSPAVSLPHPSLSLPSLPYSCIGATLGAHVEDGAFSDHRGGPIGASEPFLLPPTLAHFLPLSHPHNTYTPSPPYRMTPCCTHPSSHNRHLASPLLQVLSEPLPSSATDPLDAHLLSGAAASAASDRLYRYGAVRSVAAVLSDLYTRWARRPFSAAALWEVCVCVVRVCVCVWEVRVCDVRVSLWCLRVVGGGRVRVWAMGEDVIGWSNWPGLNAPPPHPRSPHHTISDPYPAGGSSRHLRGPAAAPRPRAFRRGPPARHAVGDRLPRTHETLPRGR